MSRRILKTLMLALVLGGVFAGTAAAMPAGPITYSVTSPHAIPSEKTAGLVAAVPGAHVIASEKLAGLRPVEVPFASEKTAGLNLNVPTAHTIVSDRGILSYTDSGLQVPSQPAVVATSGSWFDWRDAGVAFAATMAALLALSAAVLGIRRSHPLAH